MYSYDKENEAVKLLKKAIDIFAVGEATHDILSRQLHMMGFQGLKRYHRLQSLEDRTHRIRIQHKVIDIFGVNIEPEWDMEEVKIQDLKDYLYKYWNWESYVYLNIGSIANELTVKGYLEESKDVSCVLKGVRKEIEKINRQIQDLELTEFDMSYYKLLDKKLHDKIKDKECEKGLEY